LEYLVRKEVLPGDVPRLLKEGGGVDAIYVEACRDAKRSEDRGDDLGGTAGDLPLACTGEGTTDTYRPAAQSGDISGNGGLPSGDGRQLAADGWGTSAQALLFANDAAGTLTGAFRPAKRVR